MCLFVCLFCVSVGVAVGGVHCFILHVCAYAFMYVRVLIACCTVICLFVACCFPVFARASN